MTNAGRFWLGALMLNAAWVALLPSGSGKGVAALGVGIALLFLRRCTRMATAPRREDTLWLPALTSRAALFSLLGLFLLPALSFAHVPHLAFWRLDGRSWLILSWLACVAVFEWMQAAEDLSLHPSRPRRYVPPTIGLFLLWASVLWLTVVLDMGIAQLMVRLDRSVATSCRGDVLATAFSIWDKTPPSEHLFLAWRTASDFAARIAYENHVHPYLFLMYAWMKGVTSVTGLSLYAASNTTAILAMVVILVAMITLLASTGILRLCRGATGLLTLFVAVGFVVTTWRFWYDLLRFNTDNPYPLLAGVFALVYACLLPPMRPRASVLAAATFVALSPIHLPMLLLAVGCLFGRAGTDVWDTLNRNRTLAQLFVWSTAVGVVTIAAPRVLIAWAGYHALGSGFLFRSGLDGSTVYFSSILQAVWSACPVNCCGSPRPASDVIVPALVPIAVLYWPARNSRELRRNGGLLRLLLFLLVPYLISAIFFPQSISIHPYLYDHFVVIPAVLAGAVAMTSSRVRAGLHGPGLLAFLLLAAAVIMSNLIAIAQGLSRMP